MPSGTEIHVPQQIGLCKGLDYIWIGARNSSNYSLLSHLKWFDGMVLIKRNPGMTIDELIGIYDICIKQYGLKSVYLIERGINTFDRIPVSRWTPDLKGVIRIKDERPDIFERLIVDVSHSLGQKQWIDDTYKAFKVIGVNHFMFECTMSGKSKTDSGQMLSVAELKKILEV